MTQVQEQTINEVIAIAQHDLSILAVLLCGSLTEDRGNPTSDVDVIVVVDDACWKALKQRKDFYWTIDSEQDSNRAPVDGKTVGRDFFQSVAFHYQQYRVEDRVRKGYVLESEMYWYHGTKPYAEV